MLQQVANHRTRGCDWLCVLAQQKLRLNRSPYAMCFEPFNNQSSARRFVRSGNTHAGAAQVHLCLPCEHWCCALLCPLRPLSLRQLDKRLSIKKTRPLTCIVIGSVKLNDLIHWIPLNGCPKIGNRPSVVTSHLATPFLVGGNCCCCCCCVPGPELD